MIHTDGRVCVSGIKVLVKVSFQGSDSTKRCIAIKVNISDSLAVVIVNALN